MQTIQLRNAVPCLEMTAGPLQCTARAVSWNVKLPYDIAPLFRSTASVLLQILLISHIILLTLGQRD